MKSLVLILFLLFFSRSFSQIKAYLDTKQFYDPQIGNYVESYYKLLEKYSFQTQDMIHFASDQELKYLSNFDSNKYYDDEAEDVFLFSPWFERRIIQHCKKYGESWWWQS
jgi:hypothetical protein